MTGPSPTNVTGRSQVVWICAVCLSLRDADRYKPFGIRAFPAHGAVRKQNRKKSIVYLFPVSFSFLLALHTQYLEILFQPSRASTSIVPLGNRNYTAYFVLLESLRAERERSAIPPSAPASLHLSESTSSIYITLYASSQDQFSIPVY